MFCLFRNTHLKAPFSHFALALSWVSALYWSYFTFIEKDFWHKIQTGQAMLVDLVLGLPLVIAIAIVLYAATYWSIKLVAIFLLPHLTYYYDSAAQVENDEELAQMESKLGSEYWTKEGEDHRQK